VLEVDDNSRNVMKIAVILRIPFRILNENAMLKVRAAW
jgi:hypothetical protein